MIIIYRKKDGVVFKTIETEGLDIDLYMSLNNYHDMSYLIIEQIITDFKISDFIVKNGILLNTSDVERREIEKYSKILDEDERLIESLTPSLKEQEDALLMIKILDILMEVL